MHEKKIYYYYYYLERTFKHHTLADTLLNMFFFNSPLVAAARQPSEIPFIERIQIEKKNKIKNYVCKKKAPKTELNSIQLKCRLRNKN